jgi:hypothetical protein
MRKIALLSLLAVSLSASPASSEDGAPPKWAAALVKNGLVRDFGTVARGAVAEHRFVLENVFLEDVEIGSVTAACGCTKLTTTKKLIKTYETAEIVAELDTRRFTGFKEATINVSLSYRPQDPKRGTVSANVQLKLRAFIRGDIVFEPGQVQFDSMQPGQTAEKRVTLSYAGRANWQILEAPSPAKYLGVSFKETGRNYDPSLKATQVTYDLLVTLKDNAPAGYFQEQVALKTNDQNPQNARVPLVVQGHIVPTLSVNPAMLMLGEHKAGETVSKNLVVRGAKGKPFRILRVSGPDDQFRFSPAPEAKEVQVIGVQFTAGIKPGRVFGKIHVATDLGDVDVDVDGQIVAGDSPAPPPASGGGVPKVEGPKIDAKRSGASGFDATKPGENILRRNRLQPVEPDVKTPEK